MTFQDAILSARTELGDTYEGSYAYASSDLLRYAIEGVREAWRVRPSLRYDATTGALYDPDVVLPSTTDVYFTVPIPEDKQPAIYMFVVFRCMSRDVTDEGNAAAAKFWKSEFDRVIMG